MMFTALKPSELDASTRERAHQLSAEHQRQVYVRTDRMFATLMIVQWLAGIAAAVWISPKAWSGINSYTHPHIWAAVLLNGLIISVPVALVLLQPGKALT